jgi:hypothetical protein
MELDHVSYRSLFGKDLTPRWLAVLNWKMDGAD